MKNSVEFEGNVMMEGQDVIQVALDVATSELNPSGEGSFAKIQFADGGVQNLDNFSAKRIAACYAQLDDEHKQQFQYMLNKDATSYQAALNFAVRNVRSWAFGLEKLAVLESSFNIYEDLSKEMLDSLSERLRLLVKAVTGWQLF